MDVQLRIKEMRAIVLFILSVIISVSSLQAQNNSADKASVMLKMLNLKTALVEKDSVTLSNLLSDDVTYGHSNGMVQTKAQLIRSVMSGEQDYKAIEPSGLMIRLYDNSAVANVILDIKLNYLGTAMDLHMAAVLVWVKYDKDWKLVARQTASIK